VGWYLRYNRFKIRDAIQVKAAEDSGADVEELKALLGK
jgi:hypothetical protein